MQRMTARRRRRPPHGAGGAGSQSWLSQRAVNTGDSGDCPLFFEIVTKVNTDYSDSDVEAPKDSSTEADSDNDKKDKEDNDDDDGKKGRGEDSDDKKDASDDEGGHTNRGSFSADPEGKKRDKTAKKAPKKSTEKLRYTEKPD